ncbi:MAG: hypothetical protein LKE52_04240 [Bacilli bacterium]|nr:hypothetical protein [Bacilli bacterium]
MASYRKTLYIIETSVFSMLMVFAILSLCKVRPFYPEGGIATHRPFQWDPVQARTVIVGSACAFLGIWGPMIVEHLTGFRVGKASGSVHRLRPLRLRLPRRSLPGLLQPRGLRIR